MYTVCCFGDSITYGESDMERGGWVCRLRHHLQKLHDDSIVYNCGVCGDTVVGLKNRFEIEAISRKPDVILFAVGINDSSYNICSNDSIISIEDFEVKYNSIIAKAKDYTSHIFLVGLTGVDDNKTMPVSQLEMFYENVRIKEYDKVIQTLAKSNNIVYISLEKLLSVDDFEDGLHPTSSGHKKIFDKIRESLSEIF